MLSNRLYRTINLIVPTCASFGAFKYTWDPTNKIFTKLPENGRQLYLVKFNVALFLIWTVFHVFQTFRFYVFFDFNSLVFMSTCLVAICIGNIASDLALNSADEFYCVINSLLIFLRRLNVEYLPHYYPDKSKYLKFVDIDALVISISILSIALASSIFYICVPDATHLYGNLLGTDKWYLFPIVFVAPSYSSFFIYINVISLVILTFYIGTVFVPLIVKELTLGGELKQYTAIEKLREADNLIIVYRSVQIFLIRGNYWSGKVIIPLQTLATCLFVVGGYVLIKHRNQIEILAVVMMSAWVIVTPLGWSLVLILGGYLHSHGQKILSSWKTYDGWKSTRERQMMNKFARSCQPVMICYEKMFVIRRVSLMVFVKGLVKGLLRILLAFKA